MDDPSTSSGHTIAVYPLKHHTIVQLPQQPPPPPPPPNLPRLDLVGGNRKEYMKVGAPLYEAAIKGDWKAAKSILDRQPELIRFAITENYDTLLHIAASAESTKSVNQFVRNLVGLMDVKDLEIQNKNFNTALALAAAAGNVKSAMTMVNKNPALINIPDNKRIMPLYMAALFHKPVMVRYLYGISNKMTGDYWSNDNRGWVLQKCVEAEIFDVAINIVNDRPELTVKKGLLTDVLLALAQKTHAFEEIKPNMVLRIIKSTLAQKTHAFEEIKPNVVLRIIKSMFHVKVVPGEKESDAMHFLRIIWKSIAKMTKSEIDEILKGPSVMVEKENKEKEFEALLMLKRLLEKVGTMRESDTENENRIISYPSRVLFIATKMGNMHFIIELIRSNPDLIWRQDDKGKTVFHSAIRCRQIKIYKLLYEIGAMKDLVTPIKDKNGNNMLHMAAKSVKQKRFQNVSGVAFQIQRELLWFEEVKKMVPPIYRRKKNKDGKTPQDLFTETHAKLLKAGEDWMKHTASQCMVVSTLIATIVFAAAFTLPGGYNQDSGIPFFRKEPSLIIFVISDAVSLICSSTSVLMFLSILTSRYAENDFLHSLPRKLVNGIATLFLSIVTMMIAFSASFFVLYNKKLGWLPITITSLAGIPVTLYVLLQYDLFRDVFKSAYHSRHLFKRDSKHILYY